MVRLIKKNRYLPKKKYNLQMFAGGVKERAREGGKDARAQIHNEVKRKT